MTCSGHDFGHNDRENGRIYSIEAGTWADLILTKSSAFHTIPNSCIDSVFPEPYKMNAVKIRPPSTLSTLRLRPYPSTRHIHSSPSIRAEALTNLFDTGDRPSLFVTKLNDKGFHLSDNLVVPGGLIILSGRPLLWDVDPPGDDTKKGLEGMWMGWGKERFRVFEMVVPRPGESQTSKLAHEAI